MTIDEYNKKYEDYDTQIIALKQKKMNSIKNLSMK